MSRKTYQTARPVCMHALASVCTVSFTAACILEFKSFNEFIFESRAHRLNASQTFATAWTPSQYISTMALSTEAFLSQKRAAPDVESPRIVQLMPMHEISHNKDFTVDIDRPLFEPSPPVVRFQSFQPFQPYAVPITFRNLDKFARRLKVQPSDSPYFTVEAPPTASNKVAPGMDVTYIIRFKPDEYKDYSYDLVCITEREQFVVAVRAIGSRAVLDFPDEVHFATCPVKHTTTKVLLVRNIGLRMASVSIDAPQPFEVSPAKAELDPQQSMQFLVRFHPLTAGNFDESIFVQFDTGEELCIKAYGGAENVNVRLEKNTLKFEPTFLGKMSQRIVKIHNRSDVLAHFDWKPYATVDEEQYQREKYVLALDDAEQADADEFTKLLQADPTMQQQISMLTRTYKQKRLDVDRDPLLFTDEVYTIDPPSGDIWPNSVCFGCCVNCNVMLILQCRRRRSLSSSSRRAQCSMPRPCIATSLAVNRACR